MKFGLVGYGDIESGNDPNYYTVDGEIGFNGEINKIPFYDSQHSIMNFTLGEIYESKYLGAYFRLFMFTEY